MIIFNGAKYNASEINILSNQLANALIKQAEVEMQTYRTNIEDTIDQRIDDIQNKIDQLSNFLENEKNKLREPRNIENPEN